MRLLWIQIAMLGAVLLATTDCSGSGQNPAGNTFNIIVRNEFNDVVRVNRVFDGSETHAVKQMSPGEVLETDISYSSDQVFIVWHKGEILDSPIKFDPRKFSRIVITITSEGKLTTQLAAR